MSTTTGNFHFVTDAGPLASRIRPCRCTALASLVVCSLCSGTCDAYASLQNLMNMPFGERECHESKA
jgi:hypothetical protein